MKNNILFLLTGFLALISGTISSQMLSENFNGSIPAGWVQSPATTWSLGSGLGVSGSDCAMTQDPGSTAGTVSIASPTLNLAVVSTLTVAFKTALVKNNFIIPNMALYCDAGTGKQFLARWGSGFSGNTTYTVNGCVDYVPPLDTQVLLWENCTYTLAPTSASTAVSFVFDAELVNGGYVLLDSVMVNGTPLVATGLMQQTTVAALSIFPNPVIGKNIIVSGDNIKEVSIFDALGKRLPVTCKTIHAAAMEINLNHLAAGTYYLAAITTDNKTIHKKILTVD